MKKIINTPDCDMLIEKIRDNEFFSCEETAFGLKAKYNAVFTAIGNPSIKLIKKSDNELAVKIFANPIMLIISLIITVCFWVIALLAAMKPSPNIAGIIISLSAPSVMWVVDIIFIKGISKLIIDEIENIKE